MIALNEIGRRKLELDGFPMTRMADVHLKIIGLQPFRTETTLWGQPIEWSATQPVEVGSLRGLDLSAWIQQAPNVTYVLWCDNTPLAWVWGPPETRYVVRVNYIGTRSFLHFSYHLPAGL